MQQVARYGSKVPEFTWIKGKKVVRLRTYNIYEITPRTILNENNEQATYRRPYHIVKQGDTWEIIEKEAGVNRYALIWENGLDEATPLSSLVGKKFISLRERGRIRLNRNKLKVISHHQNSHQKLKTRKPRSQRKKRKRIKKLFRSVARTMGSLWML